VWNIVVWLRLVTVFAGFPSDSENMKKWRRSAVACATLLTAVLVCHAKETEDQVTYDQRQNGDLNVHVHVQDVGILAVLDETLFGGVGVSGHTAF
jgi:uncharacterized protein GlcG (DUF336 family)